MATSRTNPARQHRNLRWSVKSLGVAVEDRLAVVRGQRLVLQDLVDLGFAVGIVHLVREVRGEHERTAANHLNGARHCRLGTLAAYEQTPVLDVAPNAVTHLFALAKLHILAVGVVVDERVVGAVEALQTEREPADPTLEEPNAEI